MLSDIRLLAGGLQPAIVPGEDLIVFKNRWEMRAGIRNVLGFSDENRLSGELASLADIVLSDVLRS